MFIKPEDLPSMGLASNFAGTFAIIGVILSKDSFALTLLRITIGWPRYVIWFVIATISSMMAIVAVFTWTTCTSPGQTNCVSSDVFVNFSIFAGAYSAAMDLVLAILPWKMIWGLKMDTKEKIGISVAMSLGIL